MENISQKKNNEMLFIDHLQDIDDLKIYGRDAPLSHTEKDKEDLNKIVTVIVSKIKETDKKAIMFITSPRIRAKETVLLIVKEIKKTLGKDFKIRYVEDKNLKSTEQGEFILPEDYQAGSFFEGLDIASKIFIKESLELSNSNLHYKFGDPILNKDGSYKYPELVKYFKTSGETYAESLIRIFTSVIEISKKVDKLSLSTEVVTISHGFNFHILRGLTILAEKIKNEELIINQGELAVKIYELYKNSKQDFKSLAYVPLDITNLDNKKLIDFLIKEVEFLKK